MTTVRFNVECCCCVVALAGAVAVGQTYVPQAIDNPPKSKPVSTQTDTRLLSNIQFGTNLLGLEVVDPNGNTVGKIKEIVLSSKQKATAYAMIGVGGFMGIGGKNVAVPWKELRLQANPYSFRWDIDKHRLDAAPGFDEDHWPDVDMAWTQEVDAFYGGQPQPGEQVSPNQSNTAIMKAGIDLWACRLSKLIGTEVKNHEGNLLGKLGDAAIDMKQGQLVYGILSLNNILELKDDLCAVPWQKLDIQPRLQTLRLDADAESIKTLAFASSHYPDLADRRFGDRVFRQFDIEPDRSVFGHLADSSPRDVNKAWKAESPYNRQFELKNVTSITGSIEATKTFYPEPHAAPGQLLVIRTDAGKSVEVHAGPVQYMARKRVTLSYGDPVTVTGAVVEHGKDRIILAVKIEKQGKTVVLRDRAGSPIWNADVLLAPAEQPLFAKELKFADALIGLPVKNTAGKDLGQIEELILSSDRKQISYAVVGYGRLIGAKEYAVPWDKLTFNTDGKCLLLDLDNRTIETYSGLGSNWPRPGAVVWPPSNYAAAGDTMMKDSSEMKTIRVSNLPGMDVENYQKESLGEIEQVVVNVQNGDTVYAVLAYGSVMNKQQAAVPWQAMEFRPDADKVLLNVTRQSLEAVSFEKDKFPGLSALD